MAILLITIFAGYWPTMVTVMIQLAHEAHEKTSDPVDSEIKEYLSQKPYALLALGFGLVAATASFLAWTEWLIFKAYKSMRNQLIE